MPSEAAEARRVAAERRFETLRRRLEEGELDELRARCPRAHAVLRRLASMQTIDHRDAIDAFAEVRKSAPDLLDDFRTEYDRVARYGLVLPFTAPERKQLAREATREMHDWIALDKPTGATALWAPRSRSGRLGGGRRRGTGTRRMHRCASGRNPDDPHLARPGGCRGVEAGR